MIIKKYKPIYVYRNYYGGLCYSTEIKRVEDFGIEEEIKSLIYIIGENTVNMKDKNEIEKEIKKSLNEFLYLYIDDTCMVGKFIFGFDKVLDLYFSKKEIIKLLKEEKQKFQYKILALETQIWEIDNFLKNQENEKEEK